MRLIDADSLKRLVEEEWFDCKEKSSFFDEIDRTPTIEPKKARWHKRNNVNFSPFDGSSEYEFTCGWCGGTADSMTNYCPNCGAKNEAY